jgi:hypothetical protein
MQPTVTNRSNPDYDEALHRERSRTAARYGMRSSRWVAQTAYSGDPIG